MEALAPPSQDQITAVGAKVAGPTRFVALGIWAQPPNYTADALRALDVYREFVSPGPAVLMGDLNSGTRLGVTRAPSTGHLRLVGALHDLGLVSAYHAFHGCDHGQEVHPTYHHRRRVSEPWHIDFCFIPTAWTKHLASVEVLDGQDWRATSDHLPLKVELDL